jgi:hypothetical protein
MRDHNRRMVSCITRQRCMLLSVVCAFLFLLFGVLTLVLTSSTAFVISTTEAAHLTCTPTERDPMLFHLKTSLGVSYKGGHWFHVAETFLTQHALIPPEGKASSSHIFFNFDRPGFVGELNGMTRLMILLGLYDPVSKFTPFSAQFLHIHPTLINWSLLRPGEGVRIGDQHVKENQVDIASVLRGLKLFALIL